MPASSHAFGTAYLFHSGAAHWKKDVSKSAMRRARGSSFSKARIAAAYGGLCAGATNDIASSASKTSPPASRRPDRFLPSTVLNATASKESGVNPAFSSAPSDSLMADSKSETRSIPERNNSAHSPESEISKSVFL